MSTLIRLPEGSVCWPVAALSSAAQDVRHAQTSVNRARTGGQTVRGLTRWERRYADVSAWVEWDWVEVAEGTVAQADPLNVRSNVLLLDDHGRPLLSSRRRATLATLVYLLPWQGPVLDKLRLTAPRRHALQPQERLAA
ncbi:MULTISPECIES: DUF4902 domain-containing protein [Roseateles]|uniref:DUF4902 domain-containing protein n=1 Tax=Pelomonas aquatica TaxID=431058 RepID=A0ABU1ZG03_9BURK|nr:MULTISPECIES: DUF4902 domain-containing protein [Roseateles]KQY82374.1 hypothetical protein ASD35_25700 [Pelomonas sp. Root1444]MDR7299393.1 hypothetical protein [Pelomonas aquatica]